MTLTVVSHSFVARDGDGWLIKNRIGAVVDRLAALGWSVTLVSAESGPESFLTHRLVPEVEVVPMRRTVAGAIALARILRRSDAVLVLMPTVRTAALALVAPRRSVVYWGSSWRLMPGTARWRHALEAVVAQRTGHSIGSGDAVVLALARYARNAELAVPLVDSEVAQRLREQRIDEKDRTSLRVLFVGSIRLDKGALELLECVEQLPGVRFRIVGPVADEALDRRLHSLVESSANLEVYPYLDWPDLREAYRWATVLVLPSYSEGMARVLHEATAFGAALVVTPVGATLTYLADGREALLVPLGDSAALVRALRNLAASPESTGPLNRAACASLRRLFPEEDPTSQFDRSLRRLAGAGAPTKALKRKDGPQVDSVSAGR